MVDLPRALSLDLVDSTLAVHLSNKYTISIRLAWIPLLHAATPELRDAWEISGDGREIRWDRLGVVLTVRDLVVLVHRNTCELIVFEEPPEARSRRRQTRRPKPAVKHAWAFAPRFRARAFGWRSQPAITRIREAVSEIKKAAKVDGVLGADGAVLFVEKLVPAIEHIDGSSGAIGTAVNNAIDALVPIIIQAPADDKTRDAFLERLWQAFVDDGYGYLDTLEDSWGELCATPARAAQWADRLLPPLQISWGEEGGRGYFHGTGACLSSLLAAGRHQALLDLLETATVVMWAYRQYGVRALAAMGRVDEALTYAERSLGRNDNFEEMARTCEAILVAAGRVDEAYRRYGIAASQGTTRLATFRALAKKYPQRDRAELIQDLIRSTPGDEGKWFATARDLQMFDLAVTLANTSPCDPKTLNRAARDHVNDRPAFALDVALASLHWLAEGWGYEITSLDVLAPYNHALQAARTLDREAEVRARIAEIVGRDQIGAPFLRKVLERWLGR